MRKIFILAEIVILIGLLIVPTSAFLSGFNYGAQMKIANASGVVLTGYQQRFVISNLSGTNSNFVIYTNGSTRPDWVDIDFTDQNDAEIPFWIEEGTQNATSVIVDVNLTASNITRFYYNSSTVTTSKSNIATTFPIFNDDFDIASPSYNATKWNYYNISTPAVVSGGYLNITTTGGGGQGGSLVSISSVTEPVVVNGRFIVKSTYTNGGDAKIFGTTSNASTSATYSERLNATGVGVNYNVGPNSWALYGITTENGGTTGSLGAIINVSTVVKARINTSTYTTVGTIYSDVTSSAYPITSAAASQANPTPSKVLIWDSDCGAGKVTWVDWITVGTYIPLEPTTGSWTTLSPPSPTSPLAASFSESPNPSYVGQTVSFTDTSTGSPTTWNWTFGDIGGSNTSALQNSTHAYSAMGTYTVALNVTNSTGSFSITTNSQVVTNTSGFTQQDLYQAGAYPLTIMFTDSTTGSIINVVTTLDSNGVTQTTSNGTYTGTFPYSVVVITASSSGYYSKQTTFVVDGSLGIQVMQLTPATTTTNSNTVWYVPKTVEFHVVDNYGNYLTGANVTGHFNSSTTLPGGLSNLLTFYGMNQNAANDAANGTLIMTGAADSMGNIVFTMLSTLNYDVYVTYGGATNYFTIHPQSTNYELRFLGAVIPDYSLQTCLYANGHTYTSASSDYLGNFTMGFSYQDTCSTTTALDYYVILKNTNTQVYTYHQTPVTSGIYTLNYTVPNVRGNTYEWFENYTRSV